MTAELKTLPRTESAGRPAPVPVHVAMLLNFIPPYQLPVLIALSKRVQKLTILVSTPMERNRSWNVDWSGLDVRTQRTLTWRQPWRHSIGFTDENYLHMPWDTVWQLNKLKPDVIIPIQLGPRSMLSSLYARFSKHARLVLSLAMSEHTELGRGWLRTFIRKRLLRRSDSVIINGHSGVRYLESLGVPPTEIFRCPYVAPPEFAERGNSFRSDKDAYRLLYMGQFIERKGLMPFLKLLSKWATDNADRQIEFDLYGYGPFESAIRSFPVPPNLRLSIKHSVPYEQLPEVYAGAGILVLPTLADDWAMVVSEALASGMPVLGSRYAQAVDDLIIDGINGWLFRPDVGTEMETALNAALETSPDKLAEMRAAARESAANLTVEVAADTFVRAILHALNKDEH